MRAKPVACYGLLLMLLISTGAAAEYKLSPSCSHAYHSIWSYRLPEAKSLLEEEHKLHPDNLLPLYLEDLSDFLEIFTQEDKPAFERYKVKKDERLSQLDKDKSSPYYYFCKSEINIHSALLRLKFGENLTAAYEINKSYRELSECSRKYPDFLPAQKDLLLFKAAIGTVPEGYHWVMSILGFEGDLNKSLQHYTQLLKDMQAHKEYSLFTNESRTLYAYMCYYLKNDPKEAWEQIEQVSADYAGNPISTFVRANLALRLKKNDEAISVLSEAVREQPAFPHIDYMMGIARLQKADPTAAFYLARYIKTFKGQSYIKDAYLKMAWAFLIKGDTKNYQNALKLVQAYGSTLFDEDKNALRESRRATPPQPNLLRARLLYDGGYFSNARKELSMISPKLLTLEADKAEYYYRMGRVTEALEEYDSALQNYGTVISNFSKLEGYFAPASCLYSAMIWEKKKNTEKAAEYYKRCQSYKSYTYKDAFDQKANAGLRRLGK